MTFAGVTKAPAQEKATTPHHENVRRTAPDPLSSLYRALGNQSLAGQPLDVQTRTAMESRFRHDFSHVRLHKDTKAVQAVGASAFTVGNHVVMGEEAGTASLAHELTHVIQQEGASPGTLEIGDADDPLEHEAERIAAGGTADVCGCDSRQVVRRQRKIRAAGPVDWKPGMRATLVSDYTKSRKVVKAGTLVEVVENPGFGVIQVRPVGAKTEPLQVHDLGLEPVAAAAQVAVPVPLQLELLDDGSGTAWGAAAGRSTAIGGARGIGYLISPPVRSTFDPLRPLASRLSGGGGPLGVVDEVATLERYLTYPLKELKPRYAAEALELFTQQSHGQSWWMNNFGLTERQLGEMPALVARMSRGGIQSLLPAEQQLLMTFLRAHAQSVAQAGKIASPAISTTARAGLSAVPGAAPFFQTAPYVVRIQVPAQAVLDVNATMGGQRMSSLMYEVEVLVFTDARGSITNVRPNPVSALGRAVPVLRWVGRGFIVVGAAISVGRIATATPQELPRVIGEEGGGWLGGISGSALAAGACIAFGIATEGIGLLICGALGGVGGGVGGSIVGGEVGERFGKTLDTAGKVFNPVIERAIWGDKPIPPLGYDPRARRDDE